MKVVFVDFTLNYLLKLVLQRPFNNSTNTIRADWLIPFKRSFLIIFLTLNTGLRDMAFMHAIRLNYNIVSNFVILTLFLRGTSHLFVAM